MPTNDEIEEQLRNEDKYDQYKAFAAAVFYTGLFCTGVYFLTQI